MTVFASTVPASESDGVPYANSAVLPGAEADLYNGVGGDPIGLPYSVAFLADVLFTAQGPISSQTAYVVAQTDLGDGNWIDVAWCQFTGTSGTGLFVLSGGATGANSFQQSRAVGTSPGSGGSNQIPLGGRLRFVGKCSLTASTSSSSGSAGSQVTVSIRYRLVAYR
jgi:hypothetical protein